MPQTKRLKTFLDENNIQYEVITHPKAYTAQRIASTAHISGKMMIKSVVIKMDDQYALAVLPANDRVSFQLFSNALDSKIRLASEDEFRELFPDCETGAMPPFGNLYGLPTYVSTDLDNEDEIIFNACNHVELIRMNYKDYIQLVQPKIVHFEIH